MVYTEGDTKEVDGVARPSKPATKEEMVGGATKDIDQPRRKSSP